MASTIASELYVDATDVISEPVVQERAEFHPDMLGVGALVELRHQGLQLLKELLVGGAIHLARRASMPIHDLFLMPEVPHGIVPNEFDNAPQPFSIHSALAEEAQPLDDFEQQAMLFVDAGHARPQAVLVPGCGLKRGAGVGNVRCRVGGGSGGMGWVAVGDPAVIGIHGCIGRPSSNSRRGW